MSEEPTTPDLALLTKWLTVAVGDPRDSEPEMSVFAPDAVWDMSQGGAEVIEGHEAIRAFFEQWLGPYEEYGQEVEEIQDLGNGVAFAVLLQRGRPAGSGAWVEFRDARVLLFADGLIERVNAFVDIDEGRSAAERLAKERGQAVSQENVELVKRAYDAFNRRDMSEVAELLTGDVEWYTPGATALGGGPWRGHEGAEAYAREVRNTWEELRGFPEEFRDFGDRVLVLGRMQGLRMGGVPVDAPFGAIYDIRNGKFSRIRVWLDQSEALKAMGLDD